MKKIFFIVIFSTLGISNTIAQNVKYHLNSIDLKSGSRINGLVDRQDDLNFSVVLVNFEANTKLNWHKHTEGQVLIIIEGDTYYQERGKDVIVLKKGDVVKCDKDTEHWHSSTPEMPCSYLAIYGGTLPTIWTEELSKDYYDKIDLEKAKNRRVEISLIE